MPQELGPVLVELQQVVESSTVFKVAPHYEKWEDGLKSLDRARLELTRLKAKIEHLPNPPKALVLDVVQFHGLLEDFVSLRDHFRMQYPNGGDSHDWTELETAKRKLTQLQQLTDKIITQLRGGVYSPPAAPHQEMPWRWFVLGVVLLLVAVGFGGWAFQQRCLTSLQIAVLQFFLPLAGGFAA